MTETGRSVSTMLIGGHLTEEQNGRMFALVLRQGPDDRDLLTAMLGLDQEVAVAWAQRVIAGIEDESVTPPPPVHVPPYYR